MHSLPSHSVSTRTAWSHVFCAALVFGFLGACGKEEAEPKTTNPPTTCEPASTTLRSLDGWSQCCEDGSEPDLPQDGTLISCAGGVDDIASGGAGGAGGAAGRPGVLGGAGGTDGTSTPPWVVITRPFEAEWDGGGAVCLHMTSNGDAVEGDVTLFTLPGAASCQVPAAATPKKFIATESATAYVCLNQYGPPLASPGPGGTLAVAFRFREGSPEALRVDAVDVHQESCMK
jgi:hypothetical protein